MGYNVEILPSAKFQIDEAVDYYSKINEILPEKFLDNLESTSEYLRLNPFFRERHKNVRSTPISGFPYILLYTINEEKQKVQVISCFHTSRNPTKYPEPE